ncbi:unnamed protein product [Notodromas monacha]|uniref:G-protein coupled receptors family 1 profile domain-containing protein n=1 Tax=Notodromas monacha TaxID=399045 RepID=A0A7R9BXG6_9CRUS|nr:unnamed protein product [Notodromas monacha]CAG0923580.1 unnamed protein product [Notodromas monacha]
METQQVMLWNLPEFPIIGPTAPVYNKSPLPPLELPPMRFANNSIVDNVPGDMWDMVDPFWYQFPPIPSIFNDIIGLLTLVLGIISVVGNSVVMYVFLCTRNLRTPSNMIIVNLAFSDFLMMASMFPFMAISCFYETWVFGSLMCELHGFFGAWSGCMSIWSMTLIAIDRFNVIVRGIGAKPLTFKKVYTMIAAIDGFALFWSLLPMFGWNKYVPEGNMMVCGGDSISEDWHSRSFLLTTFVYAYCTPLLTIVFCYSFIVKAVAAHERSMREQAQKMNVQSLRSGEGNKTSVEVRLAKVAMMTITLWFLAWTPYAVINFVGMFARHLITPFWTMWGSVFAKFAAVYNPIVYGISHPRYRAALRLSKGTNPTKKALLDLLLPFSRP